MKKDERKISKPAVQRIMDLVQENELAEGEFAALLGVTPSAVSKWKYGKSTTYLKYIDKICELLNTSPNYIFLGTAEKTDGLVSKRELSFLSDYRMLDAKAQKLIRELTVQLINNTE